MDIGKQIETVIIEPLESPVPAPAEPEVAPEPQPSEPTPEPATPETAPEPDRAPVPA